MFLANCHCSINISSQVCLSVFIRPQKVLNLKTLPCSIQRCIFSQAVLPYTFTSQHFIKMSTCLVQFSSVAQSCPTFCNPMNRSMTGLPVHHQLPEFTQTHVHRSVMPSSHLILCRPLLLPSIPPSIRVFSNESTLHIRWPKYWSFSFSISPSNEYSGLISFRMNCLNLLPCSPRGSQESSLVRSEGNS